MKEQKHKDNVKKKSALSHLCQEKINKHKLEMKLIDVNMPFDNSKIIFTSPTSLWGGFSRVSQDLAGVFKMH